MNRVYCKKEGVKMYQAGLVLEGGGMKGVYTAGVLDFFLDKGMEFSSVYGVSAGACTMCSYLAGQKERGYRVIVDYLDNKHYCSAESLLTSGDLFNATMCYDLVPNYLNPYDYEAFAQYKGKAMAVVTNIKTGQAEYIRIKDGKKDMKAIQASSSLPLVSRNVKIGNSLYLDGGISDAIPIQKSILDGNTKNVVVMTKQKGFVRKPASPAMLALIKARYLRYPKVYELMKNRHIAYNRTLDYLKRQEENGKAFILQPEEDCKVGRIEKDEQKLEALYRVGYRDAERNYENLLAYLGEN